MFKDKTRVIGKITIQHFRDGKEIKGWQEYKFLHRLRKRFGINFPKIFGLTGYRKFGVTYFNLAPTVGLALMAGRIEGSGSPAAATYMAVGTGTTAPAAGNTTLEAEITNSGLARAAGTPTLVKVNVNNDTAQLVKQWSVTGTKAITEMGIFNAASAGTLLVRNTFSAYNVVSGDTFKITHKLTFANA